MNFFSRNASLAVFAATDPAFEQSLEKPVDAHLDARERSIVTAKVEAVNAQTSRNFGDG